MTTASRPGEPPQDEAGRSGEPVPAWQSGAMGRVWRAVTFQRSGPPGQERPPRWGMRMLAFLALAIVALLTASELGRWTPGTLGCTVIGLGGALYSTVKGLRNVDLSPRRELQPEHLDPEADRWNAGAGWPAGPRTGATPSAPSAPASPSTDDSTTETDR